MADPKIRFKRSSVQGKTPTVEQLPLGEAALNTFDGRLYVSKSTDSGLTTSVVNVSGFNLQEEGTFVGYANTVNFVGGTISVGVDTNVGIATVTVSGGGVGISSAGSVIGYGVTTLNFIGVGNTFKLTGNTIDISISSGGGTIGISSAGNRIGTGFTDLNFVGTGVSIVGSGTTVSIQVEPGLVGAAKSVTSFTATTSQTTFNVNYSQGQENVFLNGVRLSESQYTATNGSTVVLSDPAADGDSVDIVVYLRGADPNRNTKVTLLPPFNGITTAFTLYQGTTSYLFDPIDERQIIVSLGGVIQQPGVAYTVGTGSSIFFSDAPGIAATCFITALFSNTVGVPTDAVKLNKQVYTPSGIQTSFTVTDGYRSGYLDVYRNGIRLVDGSDFTASNGTTFSLTTPATGGDVVDIIAYKTLNISYAEFAGLSTNVDGGYGSLTNLQVSGISTLGNVLIGVGGTDLLVKGNARVTGILTVGPGSITFDGVNNKITGINDTETTTLSVGSGGTVITTTGIGSVGIGTTDPLGKLQIKGDGNPVIIAQHADYQVEGEFLRIARTDSPEIRYHSVTARHDVSGTGNYVKFKLHDSGGDPYTGQNEVLNLYGNGNVTVPTGNLVFGTSGKGIDFSSYSVSGTSPSQSVLDDYEQGTWTPVYAGVNTEGMSNVFAYYTKIGNLIVYEFTASFAIYPSGLFSVYGVPYSWSQAYVSYTAPMGFVSIADTSGTQYKYAAQVQPSQANRIYMYPIPTGGAASWPASTTSVTCRTMVMYDVN